jgi:hypothetical protein
MGSRPSRSAGTPPADQEGPPHEQPRRCHPPELAIGWHASYCRSQSRSDRSVSAGAALERSTIFGKRPRSCRQSVIVAGGPSMAKNSSGDPTGRGGSGLLSRTARPGRESPLRQAPDPHVPPRTGRLATALGIGRGRMNHETSCTTSRHRARPAYRPIHHEDAGHGTAILGLASALEAVGCRSGWLWAHDDQTWCECQHYPLAMTYDWCG